MSTQTQGNKWQSAFSGLCGKVTGCRDLELCHHKEMDNPFPSQMPYGQRKPNPRIDLYTCFSDCALYTIGAVVTIAIATLDITTDWLVWSQLSSLDIETKLANRQAKKDDVEYNVNISILPALYFYLTILATVVYALRVSYTCVHFRLQRVDYKAHVDGLIPKDSFLKKCTSDVIITLQVLFENLPLSVVLFLLQLSISCQLYVVLYGKSIVLLSLSASVVSIIWRFGHTIWNWGCMGKRETHHSGIVLSVIRSFNIITLCITFSLLILNIILVTPLKHSYYESNSFTRLTDKVNLDRWVNKESVIFTISTDEFVPIINMTNQIKFQDAILFEKTTTVHGSYHNIIRLKDIFEQSVSRAHINIPCNEGPIWTQLPVPYNGHEDNQTDSHNSASIVFTFQNFAAIDEVFYNIEYFCSSEVQQDIPNCDLQPMHEFAVARYPDSSTRVLPIEKNPDDSSWISDVKHDIYNNNPLSFLFDRNATGFEEIPSIIYVIRPLVMLSNHTSVDIVHSCDTHFIHNNSLHWPNYNCY